jgi:LemA protein
MVNELDEINGQVNQDGRDINVIDKQIPVKIGIGSVLFEILLWVVGLLTALIATLLSQTSILLCILGILPGVIFLFMKVNAASYLRKLQQKIQSDASQIDSYLEQRVIILKNVVPLLAKAIDLDKDVMKTVAALRGGVIPDGQRDAVSGQLDTAFARLFPQVEAYPDLKAHAAIADAMRQNSYLQKEITAARTLYNDSVNRWNSDIFDWPTKMIVAARAGYTTRIPFSASAEIKAQARETFF